MLSEISQSEEDKYRVISHICGIWWTNKLRNKVETEAWTHGSDWELSEGKGLGGLDERRWKKVKRLTYIHNTQTQTTVRWQPEGERGGTWVEVDKGGGKCRWKGACWGWGVHNAVCTWCFIELNTWNLCSLENKFTPINSISQLNK